jgi:hypothetical protein
MTLGTMLELERLIASCPNDARRHGAARRLAIRLRPLCVKRKPPIEAEPGGAAPIGCPNLGSSQRARSHGALAMVARSP